MLIFNAINKSSNVTQEDFKKIVEACRIQLQDHAAQELRRPLCEIKIDGDGGIPIVILDSPDVASALGYHTQDPNGKVWCRVFTNPILNNGGTVLHGTNSVAVVFSHEILETFFNPYVNLWSNRGDHTFVALEVCDPVQGDSYEVDVDGEKISVSNYVLECWFDKEMSTVGLFDHMGKIKKPLELSKNGYNVIFDSMTGEVKSIFGSKEAEDLHAKMKPTHPAARSARNKSACPQRGSN